MKISKLSAVMGLCVALVMAGRVSADSTGVEVERVGSADSNAASLYSIDVYATFDDPADLLLGVAFANVASSTGAYFQHPFGDVTAPSQTLVDSFPEVAFDSFVTIGLATVPMGVSDGTDISPDFDQNAFQNLGMVIGDWFNAPPDNGQGDPDVDGRVLIARLSLEAPDAGETISGTLEIGWSDPADPMNFILTPVVIDHTVCPWDLNNDGNVGVNDFLGLLGAWGPVDGNPPFDALADTNQDGNVGVNDFLELLGHWGPC